MNRVWTYIIGKTLTEAELSRLRESGLAFVKGWTAHDLQLHASFEILYGRIIVVKVNEQVQNASGCSIDKLSRFIKETEASSGTELLNRFLVAFKTRSGVEVTHASKIPELMMHGVMDENTIVFNTAAANEEELAKWEQPLKNTWLSKYLQKAQ